MSDVLQAIADIYKKDDPEDADFYTLEWVQGECAEFNRSPEEMLAYLQDIEARAEALELTPADDAALADLPPDMVEKLSGPIDGYSKQLMSPPSK